MNNRVAMITGPAVGIGRAVALKMAQNGANLVLLDTNEEGLKNLLNELSSYNVDVLSFYCDVSNEEMVKNVTAEAIKHFGKIDILVNNAALWRNFEAFVDIPIEKWRQYIDINVMGVVYCTKAVLPQMIENNYGRIVNVASVAGVYGNFNMSMYSATKGAIIALTKSIAKEVVSKGIVVNSVSPGTVSPSNNLDVNYVQESGACYARRTGSDEENADLICFLASEKNGYIVGQNIQIDGCRKSI